MRLFDPSEKGFGVACELIGGMTHYKFHQEIVIPSAGCDDVDVFFPHSFSVSERVPCLRIPCEYVDIGEIRQNGTERGTVVVVIAELIGLPVKGEIVFGNFVNQSYGAFVVIGEGAAVEFGTYADAVDCGLFCEGFQIPYGFCAVIGVG